MGDSKKKKRHEKGRKITQMKRETEQSRVIVVIVILRYTEAFKVLHNRNTDIETNGKKRFVLGVGKVDDIALDERCVRP